MNRSVIIILFHTVIKLSCSFFHIVNTILFNLQSKWSLTAWRPVTSCSVDVERRHLETDLREEDPRGCRLLQHFTSSLNFFWWSQSDQNLNNVEDKPTDGLMSSSLRWFEMKENKQSSLLEEVMGPALNVFLISCDSLWNTRWRSSYSSRWLMNESLPGSTIWPAEEPVNDAFME